MQQQQWIRVIPGSPGVYAINGILFLLYAAVFRFVWPEWNHPADSYITHMALLFMVIRFTDASHRYHFQALKTFLSILALFFQFLFLPDALAETAPGAAGGFDPHHAAKIVVLFTHSAIDIAICHSFYARRFDILRERTRQHVHDFDASHHTI